MNLLELKDKIKSHLVAGYPGLFIHSGEEARIDAVLADVAAQLHLSPKEWNLGYGWVDFHNKQPRGSQGPDTDLATSLPALLDDDLDGKLFVIKDARSALEHQPLAVARLKQLLNRIQRHHRGAAAVVLVSETLHIPPQIEAQITLLPLPLPRGEEIVEQIGRVCRECDLLVPESLQQRLQAACSGLSQEEIRSALAMVRLQHEQINDAALALIQREKEQIIAKSGVLEMLRVNASAADIGGLENLKQWLERRAQIFRRLGEAREARVQAPKGVLIAGMPGCGKSLTAKAAAGLFQLPLLRLDIGSLLGKYVGESEHNMRRALTMAESVSPCILWIDELEKAFVGMTSGSGSEVSSRLFGYFLTWMQEKTGAVFVIATANNVAALPPELLRKGRFDEVFYVGFPNAIERGAILDIQLRGETLELDDEQRRQLVSQCRDYAGADIQNAINEARETAFLADRALTFSDLEAAIDSTVPLRETLREQVAEYEEIFEKLKLKPASRCDGLSVAQMIQMAESANALRREEVARNEDCPDDLLEKLALDPVGEIRNAVYRNPNCPERVLTLRINIDEGAAGFDRELLHLACLHPHAPQDLLASRFQWLALKPDQRRQLAVKSSHESLLRQLLHDEDTEVRVALAHNRHLGIDGQRQLGKDTEDAVRLALAGNPLLSGELQSLLSRDPSGEVRATLARLPTLGEKAQLNLGADDDIDVLLALAARHADAQLPEAVQMELTKSPVDVRLQLAGNPATGAAAQLLLAQDAHVEVRKTLAGHPALGSATVQYLIKDVEAVLVTLAGNHGLSPLQLRGLVQHESGDVRKALAGNTSAGLEILGLLSRDPLAEVREELASNETLSAQIIDTLLRDPHSDVREAILLWHKEVDTEQQQRLANDPVCAVRERFAWHNATGVDIHEQLLADNAKVRAELASNRSTSISVQQRLALDPAPEVRCALARNAETHEGIQVLLAEDPDVQVRVELAGNEDLAGVAFPLLLKDVEEVQLALAANRGLMPKQYGRLARSGFDKVQMVLAGNPFIDEELIRELGQHAVATTPGSIWTIQHEPSPRLLALARNPGLGESLQREYYEGWKHSPVLMQALAGNRSLVPGLQLLLARHPDTEVRRQLANNEKLAADVARVLLEDMSVRTALIRSQVLDADIEQALRDDHRYDIRFELAGNRYTRTATQLALATDHDVDVRRELLTQANAQRGFILKLAAQAALAQDDHEEIRVLLAQHPHLGLGLQARLAEDEETCVREALAARPSGLHGRALSEEVQLRLLKDPQASVRMALAGNAQLLPHVQLALSRDSDTQVRIALIRKSGSFGPRLLMVVQKSLANDASVEVRSALADALFGLYPPATSEEILLGLAGDSDHRVKEAIVWALNFGEMRFSDAVIDRLRKGLDKDTLEALEEALASCED